MQRRQLYLSRAFFAEVLGIRSAVDAHCDSIRLAFGEVSQFVSKRRLRIGAFVDCGRILEGVDVRVRFRRRRAIRKTSKLYRFVAGHCTDCLDDCARCAIMTRAISVKKSLTAVGLTPKAINKPAGWLAPNNQFEQQRFIDTYRAPKFPTHKLLPVFHG